LEICRGRIAAAGSDPQRVKVVAVTKGFGIEAVTAAAEAGLADIGENYAQDLLAKKAALAEAGPAGGLRDPIGRDPSRMNWHFIGAIQRNKIVSLAPHVYLWQTIDRLEVGQSLAQRRPGANVLVQVNITELAGRPGCSFSELEALVDGLGRLELVVGGVMGVGPGGDPANARVGFRSLARRARDLGMGEISMGMSDDLEVAVAEGSTMLRLGRALFGPRPVRSTRQRYDR
jgi:pyridoxal phosphate enzyme (YggS family)